MPYIQNEDKKNLDKSIKYISTALRTGDFRGRLNYTISTIFSNLLQSEGMSYRLINDFIGVLECAKLEAYRRIAAPYEDSKKMANGDIYPPSNIVIRNCLQCGDAGETFSANGLCLKCVMLNAGFDESAKSIQRFDADIDDLSKDNAK